MNHKSSTLAAPTTEQGDASAGVTPGVGRAAGGLGRGLAGILGDVRSSVSTSRRRGLHQLMGRGLQASLPRVRQFVTDTALVAIADGFGAEAVVIARRDGIGLPAVVSSRIPPSWEEAPGLTFELFGQLWRLLDEATAEDGEANSDRSGGRRGVIGQVVEIGGRQVWLGRQETVEGYLVAAVARDQNYTAAENETLGRLVRSLAVAVGADGPTLAPGALVGFAVGPVPVDQIRADQAGDEQACEYRAEVCLESGGVRRDASGVGATPDLAVARAAAGSCGVACTVRFAGRTRLDGAVVTLVLVDDGAASPLLGLSVTDVDDGSGAIEAVVSAVSLIGPSSPGC